MKALVLCAGYGTRLGDLTREIPKPMLPLAERPLLAYLLGHLRNQGVRDIAINLHFQPEIIQRWFGDGSTWNLRLHYSPEPTLLGTAGAIRNLDAFFRNEDVFLVQYGDILTDQPLQPLLESHRAHRAIATILVHARRRSNSVVALDPSGKVTAFHERPPESSRPAEESPWVNSGLCLCSPEILDLIPPGQPSDLPRDIFPRLVASGRLFAVPLQGFRCAIDSPQRLEEARHAVLSRSCSVLPLSPP